MIWPIVIICILLTGFFYLRMRARGENDRQDPDTGLAILDFGRAFPEEAIRAIHATADEQAYFVRLHDGKAGFMVSQGHHYACHVIEAGKVNVKDAASGRGLAIHFVDFPQLDGTYEFRTAQIAAEVSLWLLDSFQPQLDLKANPSA